MDVNMTFSLQYIDCFEYMSKMDDGSVDLIITDPPYDIKNTNSGSKSDLSKRIQNNNDQLVESQITIPVDYKILCAELKRICKDTNIYIWCNKAQIPYYLKEFYFKYKCSFDIIKWVKTNATPNFYNKYTTDTEYCLYFRKGGRCMPQNISDASTLYYAPTNKADRELYGHPTPKPIEILRKLIRNSSLQNDHVFDPFAGSGSTLVAAISEGRNTSGCELNQKYYETALRRLETHKQSKKRTLF